VTYLHDYLLWGTNYVGSRITRLGLHLANAWLVYCLTKQITREGWVAFLAGVIAAIHPIHPEAVACIAGRQGPAGGVLLPHGFRIFYAIFQSSSKPYRVSAIFGFIFVLMGKEVVITLPLVLIAYTLILTKPADERVRTRGDGRQTAKSEGE
jgi:protein O-mannosyl-transferase